MTKLGTIFRILLYTTESILFINLIFCLFSCSEEISSSNTIGFDSARFTWSFDTIIGQGFNRQLYTPDTNNIFVIGSSLNSENSVAWITNYGKQYYDFSSGYTTDVMLGNSIDNTYLFGIYVANGKYQPTVWKWSGGSFDKLNTDFFLKTDFKLYTGFYVSPTEMWIGCSGSRVLLFDGNDFGQTNINFIDSLVIKHIYHDRENKLKLLGYQFVSYDKLVYYIYEFKDNQWIQVFSNTVYLNDKTYYLLNKDIIGLNLDAIYSFDGQNLHKVIDYYNMTYINRVAGISLNDFIGMGRGTDFPDAGLLFHWNGKKWSKEVKGLDGWYAELNKVDDNFYVAYNFYGPTKIFKGRRK